MMTIEPRGDTKLEKKEHFPGRCDNIVAVWSGRFGTLLKPPRARRPLFVKKKAIIGSVRD